MNRKYTNRILVFIGAAILFLILAYGFVPEVLSGKIVNQSDFSGWRGMAQETLQHNSQHPDDPTYWTNSMFGGMPNVSMYDDFKGDWTIFDTWTLLYYGDNSAQNPDGDASGIETPEAAEVVSTTYYTLGGVTSSVPVKGINIVKSVMSDGTVKVSKILVK